MQYRCPKHDLVFETKELGPDDNGHKDCPQCQKESQKAKNGSKQKQDSEATSDTEKP